MNIIVLVKQVPDTTEVSIDPRTGNLNREGVESIVNPDDRHALEAALRIKEKHGGRVKAISMGPDQAVDALSEALGMGADEGILLTDPAFAGADTWATSFTLARAIRKNGAFDLILCGRQAIDGDTAQVGPQLAELLDIRQVTAVCGHESFETGKCRVIRRIRGGRELVQSSLPALWSVVADMNSPRYPHMERLIRACRPKSAITVWNAADLGVKAQQVGLLGSLTQVIGTFPPKTERKGEILEGDPRTMAGSLVDRLRENQLI
ncbi:MAG: electron transfer flavoprotein subunit beta/FixA family protein [Thermodesulfobacteriota bacterium]